MNVKNFLLPTILSVAMIPMAALAEQPSYNFVEGGYLRVNLDDIDIDPDGIYLKGNFALGDSVFFRGGYIKVEEEISDFFGSVDVEVQELQLGLGYRMPMGVNSSWYVAVDYLTGEIEIEFFGDADTDGFQLATGARGYVSEKVELYGELGYVDVEGENGLAASVGGIFHLTRQFGLTLEAGLDDDSNTSIAIGGRLTF